MFTLEKEVRWEAAHRLPGHDGKCARLHGHSYRAVLVLESPSLIPDGPKRGMVQDYADVEAAVRPVVDEWLDHRYLNETLGEHNTTSEAIARWLFHRLKEALPLLVAVRLHETCTTSTEYRPGAAHQERQDHGTGNQPRPAPSNEPSKP
jgi:6-pyruvoyltetrahydropterin/6-carboxytetrahydropterin synthase